ncbi:hypothetical protein ACFODL_05160 [Phenylobacterium terrae]|uniref:Uncharacterized protein n=1 Tax=Phenylobacterium terrae TaxID=2665495 RepID=A0ABW4MV29_9CAUL
MRYIPLDLPVGIRSSQSGLTALNLTSRSFTADFFVPDDQRLLLRVEFPRFETFRVLDEMPLSTEGEEIDWEGHVPDHLAYELVGGYFWRMQSEAFRMTHPDIRHYEFVTGDLCLDVLTDFPPLFSVISRHQTSTCP